MGGFFRTQASMAERPPVCFVESSPYVVIIHTLAISHGSESTKGARPVMTPHVGMLHNRRCRHGPNDCRQQLQPRNQLLARCLSAWQTDQHTAAAFRGLYTHTLLKPTTPKRPLSSLSCCMILERCAAWPLMTLCHCSRSALVMSGLYS